MYKKDTLEYFVFLDADFYRPIYIQVSNWRKLVQKKRDKKLILVNMYKKDIFEMFLIFVTNSYNIGCRKRILIANLLTHCHDSDGIQSNCTF